MSKLAISALTIDMDRNLFSFCDMSVKAFRALVLIAGITGVGNLLKEAIRSHSPFYKSLLIQELQFFSIQTDTSYTVYRF